MIFEADSIGYFLPLFRCHRHHPSTPEAQRLPQMQGCLKAWKA